MSFSQELKDFVASSSAGMKLANDQQENAAKAKHYAAIEKYYDAKTPDDTPAIDPNMIAEGRSIHGPGGTGLPGAVPAEPTSQVGKWWTPERMQYAANYLEKNAGLSPYGAAGLVARWAGVESKDAGPESVNPKSGAYGIGQWLGDRLPGIKGVADFDKQLAYAANELKTREKGAADVLRGAKSEQDAARGASMFERAEGYDDKTGLDKFTSLTPVGHVYRTVYGNAPHAACGGMIQHYADGGAVQQKPYYAPDLMSDVGDALGKLGDVVRGGFQSISDTFGLHERPAVASADPDYMKRIEAYARDPGADPQQVQEVKRTVDPDNQLGDALATTYGMVKSYEHHLMNGNQEAANKAAGQILLYTRMKSQQLGALAVHAMQEGDESTATKAIAQAYNFLPNSQKLEMQDGKAILIDQKSGKPIREVEFTPATLLKAAYGFSNGEAFLNDLQGVMQSDKEKVAGIKAQSAVDVAGINAGSREKVAEGKNETAVTTTGMKTASNEKIAEGKNETAVATTGMKTASNEKIADGRNETAVTTTGMKTASNEKIAGDNNQNDIEVANINQGGANYRADRAADTSRANNQDTNATNRDIAGVRADTAVETTKLKNEAANERNALTNTTRAQTTLDILDAKKSEGAANRASREGIAADKIASTEKQTDQRIGSREKIAGDKIASQEKINQNNNATSRANTTDRIAGSNERNINNNQTRREINQNNNATSRANTQDRIDAAAANTAIKVDADQQKAAAANQENDRRVGRKAALTRQGSQLTRLDKMTDHAILGVDETTTPTVSAGQAQATRNIARGIVEASGKIAGDEAASYARQMTRFDKASGRPVVKVKLNPADNSVTMPDGVTIPLSESAFKEVARIHGGAR